MARETEAPRFGPGQWVTLRPTGEHVRIESWSPIAAAYRVRSRKNGLQFMDPTDLEEICAHPDVHLGKHWSRCPAPGCGAPLTPGLATCPRCQGLLCTCGRCACGPKTGRSKTPRRKTMAAKAR